MGKAKFENAGGEFINLHESRGVSFGVAITWEEEAEEIVVICGSRSAAEAYLTKTQVREPYSAEVVVRDELRIYGPWETA